MTEELKCHNIGEITGGAYANIHEQCRRIWGTDGASPTCTVHTGGGHDIKIYTESDAEEMSIPIKTNNQKGYEEACPGDSVNIAYPTSNTRRDRVGHGTSQTIDTAGGELQGVVEEPKIYDAYNHSDISASGQIGTLGTHTNHGSGNCGTFYVGDKPHFRIRKLTERECFRLMGMADEDSAKLIATQNKTSLYHLAGDSIVTTVLMAIFGEMFGMDWESKVREHVERLCGEHRTV